MIVTDVKRIKAGKEVRGFYMDGYLWNNLQGIPAYLRKAWDVVGIVSGHGKVRIGKSTAAAQLAYAIAWLIAGGKMIMDKDGKTILEVISPKKTVNFNLKENVVFDPDSLKDAATNLYKKYGNNQVIVYDEGRAGLDSSRAMENINKGMEDFFQECGVYGHVIIIVLPNFFKLHEDYAVARSLFLLDCYTDNNFNRGHFSFYNELKKEQLFFFGKKKLGVIAKYKVTSPNFYGRFSAWLPFDKKEYEALKMKALEKKKQGKIHRKFNLKTQYAYYIMRTGFGLTYKQIQEAYFKHLGINVSGEELRIAICKIKLMLDEGIKLEDAIGNEKLDKELEKRAKAMEKEENRIENLIQKVKQQ